VLDTQPAKTNYQSQIGADLLTVFWFWFGRPAFAAASAEKK
jgi:hypothetical protein